MRGRKLRAAAVQLRPDRDSAQKTIFQALRFAKQAAEREADIICLPEHWLPEKTIPAPMDPLPGFQALAEEYGVSVVVGAYYEKLKGRLYLSSPIVGPDGRVLGRQFKVHLFWRERKIAVAGREYNLFRVNGFNLGILVCYDVDFPEASRAFALKGAELLCCPSRIIKQGIIPWHQYVTVRSLENRIPIIAPNVFVPPLFMGHSLIVSLREDPKRKIAHPRTKTIAREGSGVLVDEVDLELHNRLRKARFADRRPDTYN